MKTIIPLCILIVALLLLLPACSATSDSNKSSNSDPAALEIQLKPAEVGALLNGKTVVTVYREKPESVYEQYTREDYQEYIPDFSSKLVFVDGLTDGLLMLRSGKADVLEVMGFTGRYLAQRNSDLMVYKEDDDWVSSTHVLFNLDMQSYYDRINNAINKMNEDGAMQSLVDQWITDLPVGEEPSGGEITKIKGADTIKIGISGDEPPLDYIAADGKPGGFNVAVLSEISRRSGLNLEMVTVSGSGRFSALQSGKIDAFLWHNATQSSNGVSRTPSLTLKIGNYTMLMSDDYLISETSLVVMKK